MDCLACVLIIGVGATALVDVWGLARKVVLSTPLPDYGLVGRWLAHMRHGRFRHDAIASASPVPGELLLGWVAHYAIGVAFAAMLIGLRGCAWVAQPELGPALIVGVGTVAAPFLLMQPAMGAGVAASRARRPGAARLQSLITHAVFGVGLYAAGWAANHLSSTCLGPLH